MTDQEKDVIWRNRNEIVSWFGSWTYAGSVRATLAEHTRPAPPLKVHRFEATVEVTGFRQRADALAVARCLDAISANVRIIVHECE